MSCYLIFINEGVRAMKKTLMSCVVCALLAQSSGVLAEENGMWRVRAIHVAPDASSAPVTGVDANDQTVPELDFTYFINKNVGMELILATTRHTVSLNGTNLGKVSLLPPTLTLQYHFMPGEKIKPYVGAGVNYTRFYSVDLGSNLDVTRNSWGGALQLGVDIALGKSSYFNIDVKKLYIKTDVKSAGSYLTTLDINPVVWGVGYGRRF